MKFGRLPVAKPLSGLATTNSQRKKAALGRIAVMPVRVARFALNDDSPRRDLYLSPRHCIFINEALIPVMYLINEASIALGVPSDMSALESYHVEFDTHEVIFAEGASVESYDGWNREVFSNFVQYERLYGREHRSS